MLNLIRKSSHSKQPVPNQRQSFRNSKIQHHWFSDINIPKILCSLFLFVERNLYSFAIRTTQFTTYGCPPASPGNTVIEQFKVTNPIDSGETSQPYGHVSTTYLTQKVRVYSLILHVCKLYLSTASLCWEGCSEQPSNVMFRSAVSCMFSFIWYEGFLLFSLGLCQAGKHH